MHFRREIAEYDASCRVERFQGPAGLTTYRTLGKGPGLILIPGIASTYRGYCPLLNRLSRSFETLVFDYPGENPGDGADLSRIKHDDLADLVIELCNDHGWERTALYGPSFGSTVLFSALSKAPDRFLRSVTQGGFVRRRLGPAERLAFAVGRRLPGTLAALPYRSTVLEWKNKKGFEGLEPERWSIYVEENGKTPIAALSHRLDLLAGLDLREKVQELEVRVLALQGTDDRIIQRSEWEELRRTVPKAIGKTLVGIGHQPHFTHPKRLSGLIKEWVLGGRA